MGLLDRRRRAKSVQLAADAAVATGPTFDVSTTSVPPDFFGLTAYADPVAVAPRVSRTTAMQVPGFKRGIDLTAGVAGRVPFLQLDADGNVIASRLLAQPERNVPRSITMTRTIIDMLCDGVAWWYITAFDWENRPAEVVRLDPWSVSVAPTGRVYRTLDGHTGMAIEWMDDAQLIRFDSPSAPILQAGARALRTLLLLDAAAENAASGVPPQDYFTPVDGADPADDTDVTALLDAWQAARKTRRTAYVPAALKYNTTTAFSPEQLQLIESRQHAITELARLFGLDTEDLGVSTTSRTYFNAYDRRKNFVDFTLGPIIAAIEDRLSMNDVTTSRRTVRADLDVLLRSDPATRMQIAAQGKESEVMSLDEARLFFDPTLPEVASEDAAVNAVTINDNPQDVTA